MMSSVHSRVQSLSEVDRCTETGAGDLALGAGFKEKLAGFEVAISDGDVKGGVQILVLEVWVCTELQQGFHEGQSSVVVPTYNCMEGRLVAPSYSIDSCPPFKK
jgi:hypothetical protein